MAKYKNIYVFCPANTITGGPDALHQITFYLNKIGCNAKIVYYTLSQKKQICIPEPYKCYITDYILEEEVEDCPENAVIVPENAAYKSNQFKYSKVFIWWLSVDNNINRSSTIWKIFYFMSLPIRAVINYDYYKNHFKEALLKTFKKRVYSFRHERDNVEHLCASHYAFNYVMSKTERKVWLCIEPISKFFLDEYASKINCIEKTIRMDCILYNPQKSLLFVEKIKKIAPDLHFIPLKGLSQTQLIEAYMHSKLYVDFGPFPGAERIPKEAVLFGCSVITGLNGASSVYEDVPIPNKYKFETNSKQIPIIVQSIKNLLQNYNARISDFNSYVEMVCNLEKKFLEALKVVFYEK